MATLVRFDPIREVAAMHSELSRLMNGLSDTNVRRPQSWVPALDVWETEGEVVYAFDLPGVPKDAIAVEVEDGALTVTATRERSGAVSEERFHRLERRVGTFSRTVGLPQGVQEDSFSATYADGVLSVTVPKPEQPKPRRIEVQVDGASAPPTIEGTSSK